MSRTRVEEVFKISGVPTYTFVEPMEYQTLLVNLRTPGRGLVIEGPSGIGKTSAVETALRALNSSDVTKLSARKPADIEYIESLPGLGPVGVVVVDDFHRLADSVKSALADYLKTLADEERVDTKVVIIGINRAGESLISFAADLANRIDIIPMENNPEHKVRELIGKGERELNIKLGVDDELVAASEGSFYIAQLLAHEVCVRSGATEAEEGPGPRVLELSFEGVKATVWERLHRRFGEPCRKFCQGARMKRAGRAPYLHILKALSVASNWSLSLRDTRKFSALRGSVGQVVDKGFLGDLIEGTPDLQNILHYNRSGKTLTAEDPQFIFYIKHISWASFAAEIGFVNIFFEKRYDYALSFAGPDRDVAEGLFYQLQAEEISVFYDKNEQHRILAEDVEEYLRPIYQSEAQYVICLLSAHYPGRIWAKFESDAFKQRMIHGEVIPIWIGDVISPFDASRRLGGISFDRDGSVELQLKDIVEVLVQKLIDA